MKNISLDILSENEVVVLDNKIYTRFEDCYRRYTDFRSLVEDCYEDYVEDEDKKREIDREIERIENSFSYTKP